MPGTKRQTRSTSESTAPLAFDAPFVRLGAAVRMARFNCPFEVCAPTSRASASNRLRCSAALSGGSFFLGIHS